MAKKTAKKHEHPAQSIRPDREQHSDTPRPPVAVPKRPPQPLPSQQDTALPPTHIQLSGGPHLNVGTGWSAMARIVREVDDQKIQDCKEDIDTILVFVRPALIDLHNYMRS
jgi:sRNA-binding protein